MTFGDIKKADAEERELQKEKRNKELLQQLCRQLENPEIKFSDVDIDFEKYDDAYSGIHRHRRMFYLVCRTADGD